MKKLLAVIMCLLCLVSSMAVSVSAADGIIETIGEILGIESEEEVIGYGITYDSNKLYSGVSGVMYEPKPTVTIRNKGTYTVTDDKPLAIDYQFVAWQNRDTGKLYYAGDKFYIDGQITFYAVWEEKTDNYTRPIRVFLTAMEALKRSIQSFFNVFKVEIEYDATVSVVESNRFDVEPIILKEDYDFEKGTRTFIFKVKTFDNIPFNTFSRTEDIYLNGSMKKVEEKVYFTDENGKIIDVRIQFVTKLEGATKYSALYETKGEVDENGYQSIYVTLTDGVPGPLKSAYVTFVLPAGMLSYYNGEGTLCASNSYAYLILTSPNLE